MNIPDEAVEAAADTLARQLFGEQWCDIDAVAGEGLMLDARSILEAAAPYLEAHADDLEQA